MNNRVVVGSADELAVEAVEADRAVWFADAAGVVRLLAAGPRARRRRCPPGRPCATDGVECRVSWTAPLRGVAPGQSAVLYDGTRVLGQATVTAAAARHRRRSPR